MLLPSLSRRERGLLFTFALLTLIAFFGPALPAVDVAFASAFADDRAWHGLPNAMDVLSNVPFVVIGGHLPSRLPACGDGGARAVSALAGLLEGGRLKSAFGPGQAGDAVVLAGNLNASGRQLAPFVAAGLADAGGPRPPATRYAGPVALALDHVLAPAAWTVSSAAAFDLPGSSHRGVNASFLPK